MNSAVIRIRDFRLLLFFRTITYTALLIQAVIVGWQIYQLKQDALMLGLIGLTEAIPAIGCSFFSGYFVDHHRPVAIMRWALLAMMINSLMLLAAAIAGGLSVDQRVLLLYTGVFISGAARSFVSPSTFALTPKIVGRELIGAAAAWSSSTYQMASILGPPIGGLIYGTLGPNAAFGLLPVLNGVAAIALMLLSPAIKSYHANNVREKFISSLRAGIQFAFGHKVLLSTMLLDMFSVLFGGAVAVLPIFADQVFKVGPSGLGVMRAAPAVGSIFVAICLALWPPKVISGKRLLMVVGGFGVCTILFAATDNYLLALVCLMVSGAFDGVSMVIRGTLLQLLTPDQMRGRVSALSSIFITSSNEIGSFESGVAAKFLGLVPSVIFGGVMTILIVFGVSWRVPELGQTEVKS